MRLKWLQRIFLILAVIMPSIYTLIYFLFIKSIDPAPSSEWEVLQWTIFILPIAILAWFMPILGGFLIMIGTHLAGLGYLVASAFGGIGVPSHFVFPHYLILVISGIVSLEWGSLRWQKCEKRSG
jgi:hypothetical protein